MHEFSDNSATAFGVILCFAWGAFLLGWLVRRSRVVSDAVQWFRKASTPRRIATALVIAGLVAFGGSKGTTNAPNGALFSPSPKLNAGNQTPPDWYVARGYSRTDSDGDGIPDVWEKWTRTNPYTDDAGLDPDRDGVSNLEEFIRQCDPMCADTDGDGIDDRTEINGLADGVDDMNPLVRATYNATEPDTDADGIPDIWGDPQNYVLYSDWNDDGCCDALECDFGRLTNSVGVVFHVTSSRSCVLSAGVGAPLFLPACTNFVVRARISTDADTCVTLRGAPDDACVRGTWKARLTAEWEDDGVCEIENDRIRTGDGVILDMSATSADFVGALVCDTHILGAHAEPVSNRSSTGMWFWKKAISLSGSATCSIHGPPPVVTATCTGVTPPLHWEITGTGISEDAGTVFSPGADGFPDDDLEISCSKLDGHSRIVVRTKIRYAPAHCEPAVTNIVGAAWTSAHDPNDASDHAPGVEITEERFGPNCPPTTNVTVRAGFTHDASILHIRNLVRIITGNVEDDETDHCIGIVWHSGMTISLLNYMDDSCTNYLAKLYFKILFDDEEITGNHVNNIPEPRDLDPAIYHIELKAQDIDRTLDRMWLVINSPDTTNKFSVWYDNNRTNLTWVESLPIPPATISLDTAGDPIIPQPGISNAWSQPKRIDQTSYMHHNAVFEMRTCIDNRAGNQATYDAQGNLIQSTIAAGTADWYGPYTSWGCPWPNFNHRDKDVLPFYRAFQLDGNPVIGYSFSLSDPCLYQGEYLEKYLVCRPIIVP